MGTSLDAAEARLRKAFDACRSADDDAVTAVLEVLCRRALQTHPDAHTVLMRWSEQGDYLRVCGLECTDGSRIAWDDPDDLAWNFGGRDTDSWTRFVRPWPDQRGCGFRLPVHATLEYLDG